jgi:hypothetical protein
MWVVGGLVFAVIAVVCVIAGAVAMKRRRDYENSDGDDPMSDAEFRKIEGFDEE